MSAGELFPVEGPYFIKGKAEEPTARAADKIGPFRRKISEMDQGAVDGKVRDGAANSNRGVFFDLYEPTHECGNLRKSDPYSNHNTECLFPVASG